MPRIYISYSHDSEEHGLRVLNLCNQLRADGIDARIDRYEEFPVNGWYVWMEQEIELADFVLIICTMNYKSKFEGKDDFGGKAVQFEGALISDALYNSQVGNKKFIPVIFEDEYSVVPDSLKVYTIYRLPGDYEKLYRLLTNQPVAIIPELGPKQESAPVLSKGAFYIEDQDSSENAQPTRNLKYLLELQEEWRAKRLSVVAGAGIGVSSGLPTWFNLLRNILAEFVKKTYSFKESTETNSMIKELQRRLENQSPLIYAQFVRSQFDEDEFIELLHSTLYEGSSNQCPICQSIARLAHNLNSILTFNYDSLIEDALSSEGHINTPVFDATAWSSVNGIPVYHPHGYLPRKREAGRKYRVILAESDYHTQYHSPNIWSNIAILRVLLESVCLFVGTSLEDPNLRRLLDASHREQPSKKHYILTKSPIAGEQDLRSPVAQAILEVFAASYQQLGVTPIWFENFDEIPSILDKVRDLTSNYH